MKNIFAVRLQVVRLFLLLLTTTTFLLACQKDNTYAKAFKEHEEAQKLLDEATIKQYLTDHQITNFQRLASGVYLVPITEGPSTGAPIVATNRVEVKYRGMHIDGTVFDSSFDNRTPCQCSSFVVGSGSIKGFDEALTNMKKGDRKLVLIPSLLGYGVAGSGATIGPDEVLVFDMEIATVQ